MESGRVAAMVPDVVDEREPITVGEANDPDASDNSAVNTFPAVKTLQDAGTTYLTFTRLPLQTVFVLNGKVAKGAIVKVDGPLKFTMRAIVVPKVI